MGSDGARCGFRGACMLHADSHCRSHCRRKLVLPHLSVKGAPLALAEEAEAPKPGGPPSHIILAAHPKTGSTTLLRAIRSRARAEGRQQNVSRVHYPYDRRWDKAVDPAYHNVTVMQSLHNSRGM